MYSSRYGAVHHAWCDLMRFASVDRIAESTQRQPVYSKPTVCTLPGQLVLGRMILPHCIA